MGHVGIVRGWVGERLAVDGTRAGNARRLLPGRARGGEVESKMINGDTPVLLVPQVTTCGTSGAPWLSVTASTRARSAMSATA